MSRYRKPVRVPAKVSELAYADVLQPFDDEATPRGLHEIVHFDRTFFDHADIAGSHFIESAFTAAQFDRGRLRRSRFNDVWMHTVRMTGTDIAECDWIDSCVVSSLLAGTSAFSSKLQRTVFSSCKLNAVNLRASKLFDVVFENCVLTDVDFGEAELNRVSFPGSSLEGVHLVKASLSEVDLRGAAALDLASGYEALRGAIISEAQLIEISPALAFTLGITVKEK